MIFDPIEGKCKVRRDVLFDQRWRYNGSGVTITQLLEQERADRRMKAETTGSDCADPSGDPDDILDPIDSVDQGGPPHQGGFRNQGGQQLPAARGNITIFFSACCTVCPSRTLPSSSIVLLHEETARSACCS